MNIKDILKKHGKDFSKLTEILCKDPVERDVEKYRKEYEGEHDILNRPVKTIGKGTSLKKIEQAKLVIRYQRKIVNMAVSFLFGDPAKLTLDNKEDKYQEIFDLVNNVWDKNKLDYFNKKLARRLFVETKVAELWYVVIDDQNLKHIKVALLCDENGDSIFTHFDNNGDMDAFTRRYKLEDIDGKKYDHVDIYTAENYHFGTKKGEDWQVEKKDNHFGKIPVIYYEQAETEWASVQSEIDRIEMLISKSADTNDYFGSPTLKIKGKITNAPEKGEVGKLLQFKGETNADNKIEYGDAEYLTWTHAPEAIKLEFETLKDIIYSLTSTPDLSFNNIQGLTKTSGEALKFMFMDSILKAKDKEEIFGEALTRRVNLLKAILSVTDVKSKQALEEMDISVKFGDILPQSITETVQALSTARGGEAIMSGDEAVRQNPLVSDAEEDIKRLEEEKKGEVGNLGESFNV
ncbi:MAG: phage portal protein [Candidatus Marinimicrobia bacterium]|nr:phage portal protein [Candidatus Neomarinimicrobiota bacterium]